jgi:hypothetical protein
MKEIPAYKHILDKLKSDKETYLTPLSKEQVECSFIDYKEVVDDFSGKTSLNNYCDILAKAISGFGNSLGGLLIFGIKDSDKSLSAFVGYKNFEVLINEFVSRSTNPKHECVNTFSFPSSIDNDKGYVIVEIPQSLNRPLQTITNKYKHRYFYRSGESHTDIPHDVLVGMLGYKIPPRLTYQIQECGEEVINNFSFKIVLRNASSIIAKDVWFNLDVGMPNVLVSLTDFANIFENGVNAGNSCNLITKNSYKMAPQGILPVLRVDIPKNNIEDDKEYHFYFTFGCDGSKMNEFNATFKGKDFNSIIKNSLEEFADFLKSKSPDHIVERL